MKSESTEQKRHFSSLSPVLPWIMLSTQRLKLGWVRNFTWITLFKPQNGHFIDNETDSENPCSQPLYHTVPIFLILGVQELLQLGFWVFKDQLFEHFFSSFFSAIIGYFIEFKQFSKESGVLFLEITEITRYIRHIIQSDTSPSWIAKDTYQINNNYILYCTVWKLFSL